MSISITERAAERINKIRNEQQIPDDAKLRVGVVSGGCSGLTYDLEFDSTTSNNGDEDQEFEDKGIKLIVDMRSFLSWAETTSGEFPDAVSGASHDESFIRFGENHASYTYRGLKQLFSHSFAN